MHVHEIQNVRVSHLRHITIRFRSSQRDAPSCKVRYGREEVTNPDFRTCGSMLADRGLVRMLAIVASGASPTCRIAGLRGWKCNSKDSEEFKLATYHRSPSHH